MIFPPVFYLNTRRMAKRMQAVLPDPVGAPRKIFSFYV